MRISRHYFDIGTAAGTYRLRVHPDTTPIGTRIPGTGGVRGASVVEEPLTAEDVERERVAQDVRRQAELY